MHRFPTGFTPALTAEQWAELENELYPEGCARPAGPDADTITGRTREWTSAWHHAANRPCSTRARRSSLSEERVRLLADLGARW